LQSITANIFWRSSGVASELLLDTGALVALLDRSQNVHRKCVGFYSTWTGLVVTSEAVLTESTHLLSGTPHGATGLY
jgi:hypothetical protein